MLDASPETKARLKIDGTEYEVPDPDEFTLGEAVIIKNYTGKDLDQLDQLSGSDPRFLAALVLIVLKREHSDVTEADVAAIKLVDLDGAGPGEEADAGPPEEGAATQEMGETPEVSGTRA